MAVTLNEIPPVAHLPLILGMLRKLEVAQMIDDVVPPHPDNVISCGRGVEALILAILDGHHALYKVGTRLEERGMLPLLQDGLGVESLNDYRLGHILDALFAAGLNRVFGALALKALKVYGIETPWIHQDTTTISLYGAYDEKEQEPQAAFREQIGSKPPRPSYGHSKDHRPDLKQVLLSLGLSSAGAGAVPVRLGVHDGNRSDTKDIPEATLDCLELELEGIRGIVADSKAYCPRTLGLCLEQGIGLITRVPRTCGLRQELEQWAQEQGELPVLLDKPGPTKTSARRLWRGQRVERPVEVAYGDGHVELTALRFLVVHSSSLAQQEAKAFASAQAKEAREMARFVKQTQARTFACQADAEVAITEAQGERPGQPGRPAQPFGYHRLDYRLEAFSQRQKRPKPGRPAQGEELKEEVRYRLRVEGEALQVSEAQLGWSVLVTTVGTPLSSDAEIARAYQEQYASVEAGFRWIKNPAAIAPVWLETPKRIAALAMLTVLGLLVYNLIQRQVRLYLQSQQEQLPGNKGPTASPTATVVLSLFTSVMRVEMTGDHPQLYGWQDHHHRVCQALGIDPSWYETPDGQQNDPACLAPP